MGGLCSRDIRGARGAILPPGAASIPAIRHQGHPALLGSSGEQGGYFAVSQVRPKTTNCPTCGMVVFSIFEHVDGCPVPNPSDPGPRTPPRRARKGLNRVGKRTMVRMAANRKLNKLGIDHCEIKLKGCWKRSGLTWAHSVTSRFLVTPEDFLVAARACKWCHTMAPNCIEDRS